jgi:elongation of very long chain fatty acids protein 7
LTSYTGLAALDVTWWYFISKFVDFFDSFFFVLRKKFSHLSTLHVVHHGGLPLFVWLGA